MRGQSVALRLLIATLISCALVPAHVSTVGAQALPIEQLPRQASTIALDAQLPVDPATTIGKLDNGITYYVRENREPKNRAELRLVVNTGSLMEDDNQLGLAHVLEHMAFNGTARFPKQEIVRFVESSGMKFGADLNASTSFDETIYMLQMPTDDPKWLDTGLQIMEDWTHAITLDAAEIEQERKVVGEEWRLGQGAQNRVRDQLLPVLLKDSRYAVRLPIGTIDSIQKFDPLALKQFYRDWYRPELMAVIAVGDFNKADVEKLIRQHFGRVPASGKSTRARRAFDVPEQSGTRFAVIADPEVPTTSVSVYRQLPPKTDRTAGGMRATLVESLYNTMLNLRLSEMTRQADAPFLGAQASRSSLVRSADAYVLAVAVQEARIDTGLQALLVEAERAQRFGFTKAEFERVKTMLRRSLEAGWASRTNRTSASYAAEMGRAFLTGEAMPGTEFEIALTARFLDSITLEEVNQVGKAWAGEDKRSVIVTMPQKEGIAKPTEAGLRQVLANASKADIRQITESTNDAPLLAQKPKGSPVAKTSELNGGITEWILANGIRVLVKPSDFSKDEIVFQGSSHGGTSLASDDLFLIADSSSTVVGNNGLGEFSATDLQRKLAGKAASVSATIGNYEQGVSGRASPADLETMFQLLYLRFTAPRSDDGAFKALQTQLSTALKFRDSQPATLFNDASTRLLYQNHPRKQPVTAEKVLQLDQTKSLTFYKDRFADAGGLVFAFAGDIDLKVLQPLVETYIGGLPVNGRKESWKDDGIRYSRGVHDETVRRGKDPKSSTRIIYTGSTFDTLDTMQIVRFRAAAQLLQNRLREVLREQLGGTYSVSVNGNYIWRPVKEHMVTIEFGSAPERADEMVAAIQAELARLKDEGPTSTELANIQAAMVRSNETNMRNNATWVSQILYVYNSGLNNGVEGWLQVPANVAKLTQPMLRDAFRELYDDANRIRVTLLPENEPNK